MTTLTVDPFYDGDDEDIAIPDVHPPEAEAAMPVDGADGADDIDGFDVVDDSGAMADDDYSDDPVAEGDSDVQGYVITLRDGESDDTPAAVETLPDAQPEPILHAPASQTHQEPCPTTVAQETAQLAFKELEERYARITFELESLDDALSTCDAAEAYELLVRRRTLADTQAWLSARLPKAKEAAQIEEHLSLRASLNARWPALAQDRARQVRRVSGAAFALLDEVQRLRDAHGRQLDAVDAHQRLDNYGGMSEPVSTLRSKIDAQLRDELNWVVATICASVPQTPSPPSTPAGIEYHCDPSVISYREKVV